MSDSIVRDIMPYIIYNSLMTDIGPFCILILNAKIPVLERKGGGGGVAGRCAGVRSAFAQVAAAVAVFFPHQVARTLKLRQLQAEDLTARK